MTYVVYDQELTYTCVYQELAYIYIYICTHKNIFTYVKFRFYVEEFEEMMRSEQTDMERVLMMMS